MKRTQLMTAREKSEEPQPLRFREDDDGKLAFLTPDDDFAAAAKRVLGVNEEGGLLSRLLSPLAEAMDARREEVAGAIELNDAAALLEGIAPQDPVEGMLAIQMVATHSAAMRYLRMASLDEQTPQKMDWHINRATKLLRTYTAQVEALKRYRSTGRQTMVVKHVHVHEGGQAIVGNVSRGEGGEGQS